MKRIPHVALMSALLLATLAVRAQESGDAPAASSAPPLLQRVEGAVTRGAHAAASGVERGAKATARAVERGVHAAARGTAHGVSAAASGVKRGAEATSNAVRKVANKVNEPAPASSATD